MTSSSASTSGKGERRRVEARVRGVLLAEREKVCDGYEREGGGRIRTFCTVRVQ